MNSGYLIIICIAMISYFLLKIIYLKSGNAYRMDIIRSKAVIKSVDLLEYYIDNNSKLNINSIRFPQISQEINDIPILVNRVISILDNDFQLSKKDIKDFKMNIQEDFVGDGIVNQSREFDKYVVEYEKSSKSVRKVLNMKYEVLWLYFQSIDFRITRIVKYSIANETSKLILYRISAFFLEMLNNSYVNVINGFITNIFKICSTEDCEYKWLKSGY